MSAVTLGLILALVFQGLLLLLLVGIGLALPKSFLGEPARSLLKWVPPYLGGNALREWAAATAEQVTQQRLAERRTDETASVLATEIEGGAMHAMLPRLEPKDLDRIVACPETGQGRIGVTAPEALAIAAHIRKHKSHAEQRRIYEAAAENAQRIASRTAADPAPHPCSLKGSDHVCCVYALRPLRCRPLHAMAIADEKNPGVASGSSSNRPAQSGTPDPLRHEEVVAQGIEVGMTRALKSVGLDANVYELNSAVATALAIPDAAERWARGENVFRDTFR